MSLGQPELNEAVRFLGNIYVYLLYSRLGLMPKISLTYTRAHGLCFFGKRREFSRLVEEPRFTFYGKSRGSVYLAQSQGPRDTVGLLGFLSRSKSIKAQVWTQLEKGIQINPSRNYILSLYVFRKY